MSNNNHDTQKLTTAVNGLARAIRKQTEVITKATEPLAEIREAEAVEISMDAQAAVETLKEICKDAEECGRDSCPIFDWCQESLPDTRAAMPPKYWAVPE